jgi:hypothetical protein
MSSTGRDCSSGRACRPFWLISVSERKRVSERHCRWQRYGQHRKHAASRTCRLRKLFRAEPADRRMRSVPKPRPMFAATRKAQVIAILVLICRGRSSNGFGDTPPAFLHSHCAPSGLAPRQSRHRRSDLTCHDPITRNDTIPVIEKSSICASQSSEESDHP